jgi:hypothetical protein
VGRREIEIPLLGQTEISGLRNDLARSVLPGISRDSVYKEESRKPAFRVFLSGQIPTRILQVQGTHDGDADANGGGAIYAEQQPFLARQEGDGRKGNGNLQQCCGQRPAVVDVQLCVTRLVRFLRCRLQFLGFGLDLCLFLLVTLDVLLELLPIRAFGQGD